jgi:hypothetical protein
MNLKTFKNRELHEKLKILARHEHKLNYQILIHIVEIDRRKFFLELAYPSLFEYLTRGIGFSAAASQRRIDAARLMQQIPKLNEKIYTGTLNLVQIGQLQKAVRYIRKQRGLNIAVGDKIKVVEKIQNKTNKETEKIIAEHFGLPIIHSEKKIVQADESIRLELSFSKEEMEKFETARALVSHAVSGGSIKDTILYLAEKLIKQKTNTIPSPPSSTSERKMASISESASSIVEKSNSACRDKFESKSLGRPLFYRSKGRYVSSGQAISTELRKFILERDLFCQYRDPVSGVNCQTRRFLEIDHIRPKWAGGLNNKENLRVFCSAHNKMRYSMGR